MSKDATATESRGKSRGGRPMGTGGRRLADAFDTVARMPALAASRRRLLKVADATGASPGEVAAAVENDAALAIAVMRAANNGAGPPGRCAGVRDAVDSLTATGIKAVVAGVDTYDLFESPGMLSASHERFRRHAVATRDVADRVGDVAQLDQREELAVAALLHDVGKLVLTELYGEDFVRDPHVESPDDRARRERRDLGIDHSLVGAVLVRRWGLRPGIATAVERHHAADADGHAAAIRLADAIVHHANGDPVPAEALLQAAARLGIDHEDLRGLVYDFPYAGATRRRIADPCPLSARETDALRGLAEGKVYKQIAQELSLSVSTIRTHLHNVYRKIGAVDRAQAVLIARDRGWI